MKDRSNQNFPRPIMHHITTTFLDFPRDTRGYDFNKTSTFVSTKVMKDVGLHTSA
jgi:hypothetical protein